MYFKIVKLHKHPPKFVSLKKGKQSISMKTKKSRNAYGAEKPLSKKNLLSSWYFNFYFTDFLPIAVLDERNIILRVLVVV